MLKQVCFIVGNPEIIASVCSTDVHVHMQIDDTG